MIKLVVAGDVCMRGQEDTMSAEVAREILASVQPVLDAADIRIVNWENPTTAVEEEGAPIPKSGAMLHSKPENLVFLKEGRFDVALMANNHTGDYDPRGTMATKKYLEQVGLLTVGAGADLEEARQPLYVEKNGETVAIISTCEYEFGIADRETPGAAGFDPRDLRKRIALAKEKADYVLVIHHGGNEHNPLPSPRNRARYQDVIDMGADALVAMHPHCPQGYEMYNGKPIVYSLGNFMFRTLSKTVTQDGSWNYGYLASLTFEKGRGAVLQIDPYQNNLKTSVIRLMEGEARETMMAYLEEISRRFADPVEHERMFMGWCMIAGPGYARQTKYDESMLECPDDPPALGLRNVFTCEAHNELITTYMRMIVEHKVDIGLEYMPAVRELQKMPVNIW